MTEKIGNVVLDTTFYPGEDYYSDGSIEDEMLDIVREHKPEEYPKIIEQKKSWPIFYHLSPFRTNIIDWLPIKKTDKVLEIGSGCGALTGALAAKAGSVTCIDLSKKRSLVNAFRNIEKDNITIYLGNFKDIEPHLDCDYDYVLLIGVFEYGRSYIDGDTPYEDFMRICNKHRADNGRMIIAIENKFGLKYWAGCKEDHLGTYFTGIEGYHTGGSAKTFTKKGLEKIMNSVGINNYSFYYPYPDYKFMSSIYSDEYLPKKGELSTNLRNFDRDRMLLFDEKLVFDQIIEEEEFPLFSNSYLVVIGDKPNVVYSKFSNDREKHWAIRTSMIKNANGSMFVEKVPVTPAACGHIDSTAKAYELLSKRYEGTKVSMNVCVKKGHRLAFSFCDGVTLEEMLDRCLAKADVSGFKALIDEYMYWLSYGEDSSVSNIDFIFPNIIVKEDLWQVIDYEWTFERHIPAKEIAFRAFYNYMLGSEERKACEDLLMRDILELTDEEMAEYIEEEKEFQRYITGDRAAIGDMRELIGFRAYEFSGLEAYCKFSSEKFVAQVFVDYGDGFSEENSVHIRDCFESEKNLSFTFEIPKGAVQIRLDPCSYVCAVTVKKIKVNDRIYTKDELYVNGSWQNDECVVFNTIDPNIVFSCDGEGTLEVKMEVLEMPQSIADSLTVQETEEPVKEPVWKRMLKG